MNEYLLTVFDKLHATTLASTHLAAWCNSSRNTHDLLELLARRYAAEFTPTWHLGPHSLNAAARRRAAALRGTPPTGRPSSSVLPRQVLRRHWSGCWYVPRASPEARRGASTGLAFGLSRERVMIPDVHIATKDCLEKPQLRRWDTAQYSPPKMRLHRN